MVRKKNKPKMYLLDWVAIILIIVGAINWGLYGAFKFDLVSYLFRAFSTVTRVIFGLVGIAGVYSIFRLVDAFDN